jgi:hypothetical protein
VQERESSSALNAAKGGGKTDQLLGRAASRGTKEDPRSMSAFTAEKREGKAPGEVVVQEAPSTPVGKETNSGSAEKMAVDGAGEGKPQATPSPVKAAGAKAQGGEAAGAGGKTGSGSKKRAATEASKAAKKAEVSGMQNKMPRCP